MLTWYVNFDKLKENRNFGSIKKIIMRYKHIGYGIAVIRQAACLVINPITVNIFAVLFNYMPVGRGSDSMIAPT